jgi:isoquinoline 1-oxidoreductase beta subunit
MSALTALPAARFLRRNFRRGGGLVVGFHVPMAGSRRAQARGRPEVNAWVVVQPGRHRGDPHRPLRDGPGHADRPGPAGGRGAGVRLGRVTTEYPTPGQNLARNRAWGNFGTGGSRGIRESHDYVRKGGATARMMLVQAAADAWGVPAAECRAGQQRDHPHAQRPHHHLRQGRRGGRQAAPPADVPLKDPKDWKLAGKRRRAWTPSTRSPASRSTAWT